MFWTEECYDLTHVLKTLFRGFPDGSVVKNPPANAGDSIHGPGRSHMQ